MMINTRLVTMWALLLAAACGQGDDDGGGGENTGGGAFGSDPSADPLASSVVEATAATIALAAPLFLGGDKLRQEQDTADDERAQALVEDAVAANSIVTSATCVAFDWSGLTATITFTDCTLEATGLPLDGEIVFAVSISPTSFSVELEEVTLGPSVVDGSVVVNFTGEGMLGRTTTADLTLSRGASVTHFTLEEGRLDFAPGTATITANGSGTITTDQVDAAYDVNQVAWTQGNACPSAGSIDLTQAGLPPIEIGFLSTTPTDGVVEVKIGNFPPTTETLAFCAP